MPYLPAILTSIFTKKSANKKPNLEAVVSPCAYCVTNPIDLSRKHIKGIERGKLTWKANFPWKIRENTWWVVLDSNQ